MSFEKGRQKTGGRTKAGSVQKATKFVDQLKVGGFDYVKELAGALRDLKNLRDNFSGDPKKLTEEMKKVEEIRHFYSELRFLLPFMAPKLREKEVDTAEPTEPNTPEAAISTDDILKALGNGSESETKALPRPSDSHPVDAGSAELHVPAGTELNLPDLDREQEEN